MRTLFFLAACSAPGGCYAPELRDCTVTCSESTDCPDDQECNSDELCAAAGVDCAASGSGGPSRVTLRVLVHGPGKVVVKDTGECMGADGVPGDCSWQLAAGTLVELDASSGNFDRWTSSCAGRDDSCTLSLSSSSTVGARFREGGD
jgi:hypothetical protein